MTMVAAVLFVIGVFVFCSGYSVVKHTTKEKDTCWGVSIKNTSDIAFCRKLLPIGIVIAGVAMVMLVIGMCSMMDDFDTSPLLHFLIGTLVSLVFIPIGMIIGEKWVIKAIEKGDNALVFGQFAPMQAVDSVIDKTNTIIIAPDNITLLDRTGFNFGRVTFAKHSLGNLENAAAMSMVSAYFLQKYPNVFKKTFDQNLSLVEPSSNSVADSVATSANIAAAVSGVGVNAIKLTRK